MEANAICLCIIAVLAVVVKAETDAGDLAVLKSFLEGLENPEQLQWSGSDPCGGSWKHIVCRGTSVTKIDVSFLGLRGTVTPTLNKLSNLEYLSIQGNSLSGALPSLNGLRNLQTAYLDSNLFVTIPGDFFRGLSSLTALYLDQNPLNGTSGWILPPEVADATALTNLSLTNTSLVGKIPDFLGTMPELKVLNLAYNRLSGGIPSTFGSSNIVQLQANNMQGPVLTGPIDAVGSMVSLSQLWLQVNEITGPIPVGLSNSVGLRDLKLNDNQLMGPVPENFTQLALTTFTVENNQLIGPIPAFKPSVNFVFAGNSFCQSTPGLGCSPEVYVLLDFIGALGYPAGVVSSWKGNDLCNWMGIACDARGRVSAIDLPASQLVGRLSPSLANLTELTRLNLKNNNISGTVPAVLTSLKKLEAVDLRNNNFSGDLPQFAEHVKTDFGGNSLLRGSSSSVTPSVSSPSGTPATPSGSSVPYDGGDNPSSLANGTGIGSSVGTASRRKTVPAGVVAGPIVGALSLILVGTLVFFLLCKNPHKRFARVQSPNTSMIMVHPQDSGSDPDSVKIVVPGDSRSIADTASVTTNSNDVHLVEAGNLVISIQVLRSATRNFSDQTVLGRGGFGVVYRGLLDDGTNIAVKRMECSSVVNSKSLNEFHAEIAVLSKVRHRHLVALLGYCIDGYEKLLVYEYLPQGALSHHLFEYRKMGLQPLSWKQRLLVALDVSRGLEYLHGLAYRSFIHRDLKPSNILLDDDFHAKVSDFGLVKLAPDGKHSVETRLAGTFGYLAPEYAVTGRVTTKADVFSFGVVLMELITGRRALDETQAEENMHLVTWFRRISSNSNNWKEVLLKAIDPTLYVMDTSSDTFESICTVAELARHCTAREPSQRPDMGHAVSVLSPLVDLWKPADQDGEETAGIDLSLTLPQALKKWQAFEDCTTAMSRREYDSQASLPTRPAGFAEALTAADGR